MIIPATIPEPMVTDPPACALAICRVVAPDPPAIINMLDAVELPRVIVPDSAEPPMAIDPVVSEDPIVNVEVGEPFRTNPPVPKLRTTEVNALVFPIVIVLTPAVPIFTASLEASVPKFKVVPAVFIVALARLVIRPVAPRVVKAPAIGVVVPIGGGEANKVVRLAGVTAVLAARVVKGVTTIALVAKYTIPCAAVVAAVAPAIATLLTNVNTSFVKGTYAPAGAEPASNSASVPKNTLPATEVVALAIPPESHIDERVFDIEVCATSQYIC